MAETISIVPISLSISFHSVVACCENVLSHTDISHALRLSSMWPINFQYHSQAVLQLCRLCQNGGTFHGCTNI